MVSLCLTTICCLYLMLCYTIYYEFCPTSVWLVITREILTKTVTQFRVIFTTVRPGLNVVFDKRLKLLIR